MRDLGLLLTAEKSPRKHLSSMPYKFLLNTVYEMHGFYEVDMAIAHNSSYRANIEEICYCTRVLKITGAEVMIGKEGFTRRSGEAQVNTRSLY